MASGAKRGRALPNGRANAPLDFVNDVLHDRWPGDTRSWAGSSGKRGCYASADVSARAFGPWLLTPRALRVSEDDCRGKYSGSAGDYGPAATRATKARRRAAAGIWH